MAFKFGRWHLSLTIVFVILGFLLSTAFSTQQRLGARPGLRKQTLVDLIEQKRADREKLGDQLIEVRKKVEDLDKARAGRLGALASYGRELKRLRLQAGLGAVSGPGIDLVIGDAARVPVGADPDSFLIHDYDLQIIVNALWRGGADAVSINGERFVTNTGIRSAGSAILINSKPQGGPYRVKAIGKPKRLMRILKTDSDSALLMGDYAQKYGLITKLSARKKVTVPAYKGSLRLQSQEKK